VLSLNLDNIENPQTTRGVENQFINGIGKVNERLLIILDLTKVLQIGNSILGK
jgi:chemotaxis signal transduction protein